MKQIYCFVRGSTNIIQLSEILGRILVFDLAQSLGALETDRLIANLERGGNFIYLSEQVMESNSQAKNLHI